MQGRKKVLQEDHDAVSHFIWCVRKRPPLYNYKLPAEQRRRVDVARIWEELANEVGNLTAAECRKKWKNLRDTYHQYRLRKLKYKECLEKWRYTADLSFLTDIYQPKLKSERENYQNSNQSHPTIQDGKKRYTAGLSFKTDIYQPKMKNERANYLNSTHSNTIHEVKMSDISSLIEVDEDTTQGSQPSPKEFIIEQNENDFDDDESIEMDRSELQFCDVSDENVKNVEAVSDDTYGEVYLYDETESNVVAVDSLELPTSQTDTKKNILKKPSTSGCTTVFVGHASEEYTLPPTSETTVENRKDELDLFFQFLKTKIQNLPNADITGIQIEFLNAVLRREAANLEKGTNVNT